MCRILGQIDVSNWHTRYTLLDFLSTLFQLLYPCSDINVFLTEQFDIFNTRIVCRVIDQHIKFITYLQTAELKRQGRKRTVVILFMLSLISISSASKVILSIQLGYLSFSVLSLPLLLILLISLFYVVTSSVKQFSFTSVRVYHVCVTDEIFLHYHRVPSTHTLLALF